MRTDAPTDDSYPAHWLPALARDRARQQRAQLVDALVPLSNDELLEVVNATLAKRQPTAAEDAYPADWLPNRKG